MKCFVRENRERECFLGVGGDAEVGRFSYLYSVAFVRIGQNRINDRVSCSATRNNEFVNFDSGQNKHLDTGSYACNRKSGCRADEVIRFCPIALSQRQNAFYVLFAKVFATCGLWRTLKNVGILQQFFANRIVATPFPT